MRTHRWPYGPCLTYRSDQPKSTNRLSNPHLVNLPIPSRTMRNIILRPRISITGSVRPSVRPSVGPSVTLSSKTREINILEQIVDRNSKLGSLDASWASLQDGLSMHRSVSPSISLSSFRKYQFQQIEARVSQEYHRIKSSYNHSIIMRTHRWPYGPCLGSYAFYLTRRSDSIYEGVPVGWKLRFNGPDRKGNPFIKEMFCLITTCAKKKRITM